MEDIEQVEFEHSEGSWQYKIAKDNGFEKEFKGLYNQHRAGIGFIDLSILKGHIPDGLESRMEYFSALVAEARNMAFEEFQQDYQCHMKKQFGRLEQPEQSIEESLSRPLSYCINLCDGYARDCDKYTNDKTLYQGGGE